MKLQNWCITIEVPDNISFESAELLDKYFTSVIEKFSKDTTEKDQWILDWVGNLMEPIKIEPAHVPMHAIIQRILDVMLKHTTAEAIGKAAKIGQLSNTIYHYLNIMQDMGLVKETTNDCWEKNTGIK